MPPGFICGFKVLKFSVIYTLIILPPLRNQLSPLSYINRALVALQCPDGVMVAFQWFVVAFSFLWPLRSLRKVSYWCRGGVWVVFGWRFSGVTVVFQCGVSVMFQ